MEIRERRFDLLNTTLAVVVFLGSLIVYALTVQRSFSFWDCGEFISCASVLGIPHPPGFPMFVLISRIFAIIPFVEDISHRINYLSVISSAFTAMFSYLLTTRLINHFIKDDLPQLTRRIITSLGGLVGGFMVAFSATNWANAVEAEVYGPSLALMVLMIWLSIRYYEIRGTQRASMIVVLVSYLAMLGVGVHLTVFLIVPICALFFILKPEAEKKHYLALSVFGLLELLMVLIFADGRGGYPVFGFVSFVLAAALVIYLRQVINWGLAIAWAAVCSIMLGYAKFMFIAPVALLVVIVLGLIAKQIGFKFAWKISAAVIIAALIGFSVHIYIPVRSAQSPRIDMNNPSRNWQSFVDFLERKQYMRGSMIERMFNRRGAWENQFGRHPHMGFWSFFEEQYSSPGWGFLPFLLLGLLGMYVAIRKRLEIGMPFFTLFILCSAGLILYMNFADGTMYNAQMSDAHMEVRNRDYFFTPAFVFFGIAIGMGVAALVSLLDRATEKMGENIRNSLVYASVVLVALPVVGLANNYHINDRSENFLPLMLAKNVLDTCEENAVLFTFGDNETYPMWCLQEAYEYRRDVRMINLSLLQSDWYVAQVKNKLKVPISLTDEQILWYPAGEREGQTIMRPKVPFLDRPRQVRTLMTPYMHENRVVRVSEMIVDDIVIENRWRNPIYFSSLPYAESPLKLRDHVVATGMLYKLERDVPPNRMNLDESFRLFTEAYTFSGLEDCQVYRDNGSTRDFLLTIGPASLRVFEGLNRAGDTVRAMELVNQLIEEYPEYWQPHLIKADYLLNKGDTTGSVAVLEAYRDKMEACLELSEDNRYYLQDVGMTIYEIGKRIKKDEMINEGIELIWKAFDMNRNDMLTFRKLASVLSEQMRYSDLRLAALTASAYGRNLSDPFLNWALSGGNPSAGGN